MVAIQAELFPQLSADPGDREARLDYLIEQSNDYIDRALAFAASRWEITAVVGLFSGGDDSTILAHLARQRVTHFMHANTQVGAEPTRQYVRDMSARWEVPLLERTPPGYGYEDLVLKNCPSKTAKAKYDNIWPGGFPGPSGHNTFFGWIKGEAIEQVRREFNPRPRDQRIVFLGGKRAEESKKRAALARRLGDSPWLVAGSELNVQPILRWTRLDLNTYRRRFAIPQNETAAMLHKSMECACGAYAGQHEMAEMEMWLPSLADYLHGLERRLEKLDLDIDPRSKRWAGFASGGNCPSGECNI